MRSTEEVLRDHLARRCAGDVEGDVEHNYSSDLVVISRDGVYRGHDGIRTTARILEESLPGATFTYDLIRVADDMAMLGWRARAEDGQEICHGADSYRITDGRIVAQTIYYEVEPAEAESSGARSA